MSVLNVDSTSNNLSVSSKDEKCIHCGKDINIHKDLYIELNKNHTEKSEKLCQDCYRKIHKNTYSVNKPYIKIKRVLDFILSLFAIIVLSPIYVVIAVLIRKEGMEDLFFINIQGLGKMVRNLVFINLEV